MPFNQLAFVKKFLTFSPREGANETKAGLYLESLLFKNKVKFSRQKFSLFIPQTVKAELTIDGRKIDCCALSFVSGKINSKNSLISTLSPVERDFSYLGFNPYCPGISATGRSIKHPALGVKRDNLVKIFQAKKISGEVIVKKTKHHSQNILVGNLNNPKNLIFAHYDSVYNGAVDNASGVAVTLKLILENPKLLKNNLFVLSGNEELAYDFPIYWGRGYREFEKKYLKLLKAAKKILIVDSVGNDKTQFLTDPYWVNEGFPIKNLKKLLQKTAMVTGNINKLMEYYHSPLDTIDKLKSSCLEEAYRLIQNKLASSEI